MDINEAIKRIQDHIRVHHIGEAPHIKIAEALAMAIDALQEKAARENPEPLTIEELKQMHGEPVYLDVGNIWGIIDVPDHGAFEGIPFVCFEDRGIPHAWDIEKRNIRCLRYKPKEV